MSRLTRRESSPRSEGASLADQRPLTGRSSQAGLGAVGMAHIGAIPPFGRDVFVVPRPPPAWPSPEGELGTQGQLGNASQPVSGMV